MLMIFPQSIKLLKYTIWKPLYHKVWNPCASKYSLNKFCANICYSTSLSLGEKEIINTSNMAQWFEMFWVHDFKNRWKWKLLCTLTMSLTLSTTSAHLVSSECSFKAFSSSSNRHSKMEEIWDTWRHKHEMKQRKMHIFFIPVCWSLAPLWRTRPQAWGWTVCRCCSSSELTGWPCSPALDAWHDGSSARWRPRASPHVHIARAAWPSGTCAPLWKWGGLEDLSVERTKNEHCEILRGG